MQQEQDTKGKAFSLKNIKLHGISMFQQIVLARSGISRDRNGGGGVPCEYALPKISGICIEEMSLWPLEPRSGPSPQTCGGSKTPPST